MSPHLFPQPGMEKGGGADHASPGTSAKLMGSRRPCYLLDAAWEGQEAHTDCTYYIGELGLLGGACLGITAER